MNKAWKADYERLRGTAGWSLLPRRTELQLTGSDRASFLHNLCTNDVRGLAPGTSCEAFFTNVQGKTIGFATIHQASDRTMIQCSGGQGKLLAEHLDRYLIAEDVVIEDRSATTRQLVLSGPDTAPLLASWGDGGELKLMEHRSFSADDATLEVRRLDWTGALACFISGPDEAIESFGRELTESHQIDCCAAEAVEIARVETGWPEFGVDITDLNLPQEVARNERAISFTKGCYLGQETVARIDALGHVNWQLRGLVFDGPPPPSGHVLEVDGKAIARLGTVVDSIRHNGPLAMAYVRQKMSAEATRLEGDWGVATVVELG